MSSVISKARSNIKVKSIAKNKKRVDSSKADRYIDQIKAILDQISGYYSEVSAAYKVMLNCGGIPEGNVAAGAVAGAKLDTSTTIGKSINQYYATVTKRAEYCKNRKRDLESAYSEATGTEAEYLSKRIRELEKEVANMRKAQQADKDTD